MRRLALAAAALLALAGLPTTAATAATASAAADPPPAPADPPSVADDTAPPRAVDGDTSSLGFGLDAGATPAGAGAAAVDTDQLASGQGFFPISSGVENFGAYRFQLTTESTPGLSPELMRPVLQSIADELSTLVQVDFAVDAGTTSCGSCNTSADRGTNFRSNEPMTTGSTLNANNIGLIRVRIATTSPCGALVPAGQTSGTVGCTTFETIGNPPLLARGSVWLSPSLFTSGNPNVNIARATTTHEVGHALGLMHFHGPIDPNHGNFDPQPGSRWPNADSPLQLMYAFVHGEANDIPGTPKDHFHNGDRNGVWYLANDFGWYLSATYRDFLGRRPHNDEYRFWFLGNQTIGQYLTYLTTSNEWVGRIVDGFYVDILGHANNDAGARAYWMNRIRQVGVPVVASEFYASPEYFAKAGSTNRDFVLALYDDLLGRAPDDAGLQYWLGRLGSGTIRQKVALDIYQSFENRAVRVRDLYCTVLDRGPEGDPDELPGQPADDGWTYWARQILVDGDLALARSLASSQEYVQRDDDMALRPIAGPAVLPAPCTGF